MEEIDVSCVDSMDKVDRDEWDSIVPLDEILNTWAYQTAIEKSRVNEIRYRYFLFHRSGKLIGHVSVAIFRFGMDAMVQGPLKSLLGFIKRFFPSFLQVTVIECGHPSALGSTIALAEESEMPRILRLLEREMSRLARIRVVSETELAPPRRILRGPGTRVGQASGE
jgi:hypothetical protein